MTYSRGGLLEGHPVGKRARLFGVAAAISAEGDAEVDAHCSQPGTE
jgi:hypothetical protein